MAQLAGQPVVWLDGGDEEAVVGWSPDEVSTSGDWVAAGRALQRPGAGGAVLGFVGFGAGHVVEAVPAEAPTPEGPHWLGRFPGVLLRDRRGWTATGTADFRRRAASVLEAASVHPLSPPPPAGDRAHHTVDRRTYEAGVRRILELLAAGDAYQINLTRPVWVEGVRGLGEAYDAYRRLRSASPASHGAWLDLGATQVLSNSPELLLRIDGDRLASDPIKGTRPRHTDPVIDAALGAALLAAAKDHAELTMIVDLVRNDLGRVALPATVRAGARRLTSHPTVHHTSCEVTAQLRPDRDRWSALAAVFPPGSVTGAPKVRACQRIAELEPHPRGVYCGTIGGFLDDGPGSWSVAIRTAVVHGGRARYHVGGGIVIDSVPAEEWEETEHKGRALAAALTSPRARSDAAAVDQQVVGDVLQRRLEPR